MANCLDCEFINFRWIKPRCNAESTTEETPFGITELVETHCADKNRDCKCEDYEEASKCAKLFNRFRLSFGEHSLG